MTQKGRLIRVMLVDADHGFTCLLRLMIFSFGNFEVRQARNGSEALSLFASFNPDITLPDIDLPRLEGVEILRAILVRNAGARVVIVTQMPEQAAETYITRPRSMAYICKTSPGARLHGELRRHFETLEVLP